MRKEEVISLMTVVAVLIIAVTVSIAYFTLPVKGKAETPMINVSQTVEDDGTQFFWATNTEYITGEPFMVMVRLADRTGTIIPANCSVSVAMPDHSVFINAALMTFSTPFQDHYYSGVVPNVTGTYEIQGNCTSTKRSYVETHSFHVSQLSGDLKSYINSTFANSTTWITANLNATNQLIIQQFSSTNATIESNFQNTTSYLQQILNQLLNPCQGNLTFTTSGSDRSRIGQIFYIRASIMDVCQHSLSNYTCSANTGAGFWGTVPMPYNSPIGQYEFITIANNSGTVNWQVTCT